MGKITIKDVGREAGVSLATVSCVLTGSKYAERISPETKRKVLEAAQRLGYSRSPVGAALQRGYTNTIILLAVAWELADSHSQTTVSVSRAATRAGLSIVTHVAGDDREAVEFLEKVMSLQPYGLLLLWDSAGMPTQRLCDLRVQGLPIVDLVPSEVDGIASVTADREQGFYILTKHLVDLGHRRIGMVLDRASRWRTSNLKLAGYRRALDEAGIGFDEGLLQEVRSFGFEAGCEGFRNLIARHPDATAVVCINDPMALGAVASAQDMGIPVPGGISIAGYGAHKESGYFRPRLTTVAPSPEKIAENAIEVLIGMRTGDTDVPRLVCIRVELMVRESTGPVLGSRCGEDGAERE